MSYNTGCRMTKKIPSKAQARYMAFGWNGVKEGFGLHPEYDSWSRDNQKNYELGRLHATQCLAVGLPLPVWSFDKALPRAISVIWREVEARAKGPKHFPERQQETTVRTVKELDL